MIDWTLEANVNSSQVAQYHLVEEREREERERERGEQERERKGVRERKERARKKGRKNLWKREKEQKI